MCGGLPCCLCACRVSGDPAIVYVTSAILPLCVHDIRHSPPHKLTKKQRTRNKTQILMKEKPTRLGRLLIVLVLNRLRKLINHLKPDIGG